MNSFLEQIKFFPLLFISLGLAFLPSIHIMDSLNLYNEKRFFVIISLIITSVCILFHRQLQQQTSLLLKTFPNFIQASFAILLCLGLSSSLLAASPRHAILELTLFTLLGITSFYVAALYNNTNEKINSYLTSVFVIAATLLLTLFLKQLVHVLTQTLPASYNSLFPSFVQPRFLNQWEGMTLPILIATSWIYRKRAPIVSNFIFVLASFLWMGIFISGGRGVIVGLIAGVLLSGLFMKELRNLWWTQNLIALFLGLLLYLGIFGLIYFTTGSNLMDNLGLSRILLNDSSSGRMIIWQAALELFSQHPLLGVGPMHFAWENYFYSLPAHPHNILIQLLTEWGLISTLLILFIALYSLIKWLMFCHQQSKLTSTNNPFLIALTTSFITANTHALFSGVWVIPLSQMTLAILIGWMLGIYHSGKSMETVDHAFTVSKKNLITLKASIILMLIGFIAGFCPELSHIEDWLVQSFYLTDTPIFWPRFWVQGSIFTQ